MEVIEFIFSSFWKFIGSTIILVVIVRGIVAIVALLSGKDVKWD
jgi:hypothetical protein